MKKLLFLGGSDIQVSAILAAKEMGNYVITCDYLPENPGHVFAHEYHNVSTTDMEGVLELAQKLKVNGIIAYASDPAALTKSYVSEKLGLPGNPFHAVEKMSRKDLFRQFLQSNGFNTPGYVSCASYSDAEKFAANRKGKVVIKPVDSSGSKGVFVIEKGQEFSQEFNEAISFSRSGSVIVEDFIVKKGYQIGGDGFLVNGQLVFRCFGDIHFSKTNPMLPCSVSVPTLHTAETVERVHNEIQRLMTAIGMKMGALNFDIVVDENNEVFIIEIGPRNGGNMIPELTKYCTGVDMKEYSIKMALGEDCSNLKFTYEKPYFSHYVIHSQNTGIVKSVVKSEELKKHILYEHYNFQVGDKVSDYQSSADRLGIMLLQYSGVDEMLDLIENMQEHLIIETEE